VLGGPGAPMAAATLVAIAAVRLAIEEVQDSVEELSRDVADLRRVVEAADVGNLAGVYRTLANARVQADRAGEINQATWDAIAPHEVTVQQSADRLRNYLRRTIDAQPLDGDLGDRYDAATHLRDEATITRTLKLLVMAEQSRLLWRSLKLEQIRRTEPGALESEADAAKADAVVPQGDGQAMHDVAEPLRVGEEDGRGGAARAIGPETEQQAAMPGGGLGHAAVFVFWIDGDAVLREDIALTGAVGPHDHVDRLVAERRQFRVVGDQLRVAPVSDLTGEDPAHIVFGQVEVFDPVTGAVDQVVHESQAAGADRDGSSRPVVRSRLAVPVGSEGHVGSKSYATGYFFNVNI